MRRAKLASQYAQRVKELSSSMRDQLQQTSQTPCLHVLQKGPDALGWIMGKIQQHHSRWTTSMWDETVCGFTCPSNGSNIKTFQICKRNKCEKRSRQALGQDACNAWKHLKRFTSVVMYTT